MQQKSVEYSAKNAEDNALTFGYIFSIIRASRAYFDVLGTLMIRLKESTI